MIICKIHKRWLLGLVLIMLAELKSFAANDYVVETFVIDATSQPPLVGAVIKSGDVSKITAKGFVVTTDKTKYAYEDAADINEFGKDTPIECTRFNCSALSGREFTCRIKMLKSSTKYYVYSYIITDEGLHYGNPVEITSGSFNRCPQPAGFANVWYAFSYTLFDNVTDEIIDPSADGFYYSTDENPDYMGYQKGTSYNTCAKFKTEWIYKIWRYSRVAPCLPNISLKSKKLTMTTDEGASIYYCINGDGLRPENFTLKYTEPIDVEYGDVVYAYSISEQGYPSHTRAYKVLECLDEAKDFVVESFVIDATSQPPLVGAVVKSGDVGKITAKGFIATIDKTNYAFENTIDVDEGWTDTPVECSRYDCSVLKGREFTCRVRFLKGNTTYYVYPYIVTEDGVQYGDAITITSGSFNRCPKWAGYANVWYAFSYTLFSIGRDEIINPSTDGFYYSTNENPDYMGYQKGTSYNTCYKFKTEWDYKLWRYNEYNGTKESPRLPEMSLASKKLTMATDEGASIYYCINGDGLRPENFTQKYEGPIDVEYGDVVYAYSISEQGQPSYTIAYKVLECLDEMVNSAPKYTVTLNHNKGKGNPEQISVTYNQPMPENIGLVAPTRTGYEFTGYSRNGTYYYDANLKSVRNFDKKEDYTLYANWKASTTTVTLNPQGGQNGTAKVTATYAKAMPTGEDVVAPTRAGYTFEGYYSSTNGNGTQYYDADMTSKRTWNKEASTATLYAYWKSNSIPVTAIDLSAATATLWVGKTKTITATVSPTTATKKGVTWSSSDTKVATVSSKGVIKAIGRGTCTITCTAADGYGAKAECEVTVKQQITSIDFGYETLSVTCGTTKTLTPTINPSNASVQTLTWKSKNTSVATVTSAGILKAIAPGTAKIICTATDGFKKADTITVEVVPLKITDSKPTIAEGTYGIGGISYTRTLTAGKYASFCLPYTVNLNDYTEEFSKVYVPMGMTFLKTNGTLVVAFKKVSLTETISAGKPFVALAAKSGSVSIVNDVKKTVTTLTNPTPTNIDVYNWNGSNGFFEFNPDVTTKIGGTYSKLTGLDSEKYYIVSTSGTMSKVTSVSPYRIYVYKDDNNSNAKITEIIFSFDEDEMATGIEEQQIKNDESPVYYNLSGQRINKANAQKGIYIKNGKKYAK